jgi:DNA-binding transcriptional regulator YiaG
MNKAQKARFAKAGWKLGTAADVLGLSDAEAALVEAKFRLGDVVRTVRQRRHLSQAALAKLMGSSQSRVAKVENRDTEVSLDLQLRAIFAANPAASTDFQRLIRKWSRDGQRPDAVAAR